MRVVVVGATGNLGTSLVQALLREPSVEGVVGIARRVPVATPGGMKFVSADIASDDLAVHLRGADAVFQLAWLFQPTHDPLVTWRANVEGSARLFDAVRVAGVKALVYASSVGAYSPAPIDAVVDERWPTHSLPTASYGREKAYVERLLDAFEVANPDIRVVRFRPGFMFKRTSATQQRRLFAGPLVPGFLARRGRLPVLPGVQGLRFQGLHTDDAADAFLLAALGDARGAFNIAADPVIDSDTLARVVGARSLPLPPPLVRAALTAAWQAHLVPAEPALLDLVLRLPILNTTRARTELGWSPRHSGTAALEEMLDGLADGAGGPTEPLAEDSPRRRVREAMTGVGQRS